VRTGFLILAVSAPSFAQNLLTNPQFDLDPTIPGNGWETEGTGELVWNTITGQPSAPSARTNQFDDESMILFQCVQIVGGTDYDFSAQSFTHLSIGTSTNGVRLSVYDSADCSGSPLETVPTNQGGFPNWSLRERFGYAAPSDATVTHDLAVVTCRDIRALQCGLLRSLFLLLIQYGQYATLSFS